MTVKIATEQYISKLVGVGIHIPAPSDFLISDIDVKNKQEYDSLFEKYTKNIENTSNKIQWGVGVVAYVIEVIILLINLQDKIQVGFTQNIFINYIIVSIFLFLLGFPGSMIQSVFLCMPFPERWFTKLASNIHKQPIKPINHDKASSYQKAVEEFEKRKVELRRTYRGLQDYEYDLLKYGCSLLPELSEKIVKYINIENGIIIKDNLRQEQQYWYKLDPYMFEEEVANWFSNQGYNVKLTPKSGDEGIDVIIRKDEYVGYVQCKRYTKSKVDRPTLNALYGVVCANKVTQGIVVCLEGLTNEALEFAKKTNIKVITINDLAPEEDLFYHKYKKETLSVTPLKLNDYWCKIGNLVLNTNCYTSEDEVNRIKSKFQTPENYHSINYKNIFYCIFCSNEDYRKFSNWLEKEMTPPKISTRHYHYKKKRQRYYRRY